MPSRDVPDRQDDAYEDARHEIISAIERGGTTHLDLARYGLKMLPAEIGQLSTLETLHLHSNQISVLPAEIGQLSALRTLNLDNNEISVLPAEIGQLSALQNLRLGENQISVLPAEIGQLTALETLHLHSNQISVLPAEIGQLSALETLALHNNQISALPAEIGQLSALKHLILDHNQISVLPVEIGQLSALDTLYLHNNQISVLPAEIGYLTALEALTLDNNRINALPAELSNLSSIERAAMQDSEIYIAGLYLEENPLLDPYPRLIAQGQPSATVNVFAWLRGELDPSELPEPVDAPSPAPIDEGLPSIPPQTIGPHVELDDRNVVTFAPPEALDAEGNNVARLRKLHPALRALADELVSALGRGNIPHHTLRDRADLYRALIDADLEAIDFALLFQAGIRLANAERAASADEDLPRLSSTAREAIDSLLALHGTFILSTREGLESITLEERYRRNPQEEAAYRQDAAAFTEDLKARPDLIDPRVADFARGAADEIGKGTNPERSGVSATGTIKNVTITVGAAAALGGMSAAALATGSALAIVPAGVGVLVGTEGLKKSKPFATVAALVTRGLDQASERDFTEAVRTLADRLRPQRDFLLSIEPRLRRLAGQQDELRWLNDLLDWLRKQRR